MRIASCLLGLQLVLATVGCGDDDGDGSGDAGVDASTLRETLFVGHAGTLSSYDIESGEERPGTVTDVAGPSDMQALADGTILVNLTDSNEILVVDGITMLEVRRIPGSEIGGTRPVHSYISPEHEGKTYWMTLNDGSGEPDTNSARFVDLDPESDTYLQAVGEVRLGIDHHKASFSSTLPRVVISNLSDCEDVLTVFDYSDISNIERIATMTAEDAGFGEDGLVCDPTFEKGFPPGPHGCATSTVSGKAYCNLTGTGAIVAVTIDAASPTFELIPTSGGGGGYTSASRDGNYIYSLQSEPREVASGSRGCQIGQLVTVDVSSDEIVAETPILYQYPACAQRLFTSDERTTEPAHILLSADGNTMFVTLAGGFGEADARVRRQVVFDLTDPASPTQLASIFIGTSTSYHGDALTASGQDLFVANNLDGTVSHIDVATRMVLHVFEVDEGPKTLATFGTTEGPGHQTGPLD